MASENQAGAASPQPGTQQKKGGSEETGQRQRRSTSERGPSGERGTERPSGGLSRRERLEPELFGSGAWGANPFSMMRRMMDDLDRMFEEVGAGRWLGALGGRGPREGMWMPQVDVLEQEGKLVVRADLPGIRKEDLRVELTDEALVIEGERRREIEEEREGTYRSERSYGSFHRQIPLPEGVDPEKVEARYESGVLEITMPLPQESTRRRRIEIQEGKSEKSVH